MDEIKVNGETYVRKQDPRPADAVKIVVLQRGWIVVGLLEPGSENELTLRKASVIRRWGTTKGLGEIAEGGPTSETVLDPTHGAVRFHPLTVVLMIDCEAHKWAQHLK